MGVAVDSTIVWNDAALAAASRTVILEAVGNLARQYDCEA